MKIISVGNPRYTKHGHIDLTLSTGDLGVLEYTASPNDVEGLGQDLYHRAKAGEFGEITLYTEPVVPEAQITNEVLVERNRRLAATDWTQLPDVPLTTKEAWATYRQALRDITKQPEFPIDVIWPEPPA